MRLRDAMLQCAENRVAADENRIRLMPRSHPWAFAGPQGRAGQRKLPTPVYRARLVTNSNVFGIALLLMVPIPKARSSGERGMGKRRYRIPFLNGSSPAVLRFQSRT